MNKNSNNICIIFQKILFIGLLYGFGVVVPLYFNDAYFDIMEAKAILASTIIQILLPLALIVLILKLITKNVFKKNKAFIISIIIFIIVSIISLFNSFNPTDAFTGFQGWYIGTFVIVSMCIFILALNNMEKINDLFYIPVLIAIALVYIFGIIDSFNIDLFKFREYIDVSTYHYYISTIGNINWYVGYLSLTSLFIISSFIKEKNKIKKIIFFILSILAVYNIASIGSDGIYLALMFSGFAFVPFMLKDINRFKIFSVIIFIYSICLIILKVINYPLNGYASYTTYIPFIAVCIVMSIIIYLLPNILKDKYTDKTRKVLIVILESLLIITVIVIALFVIIKKDPNWGTGRYEIWKQSFISYNNFPIKYKVFGLGPELLNNVYASLSSNKGVIYQTSHSEPIQLLLTMGIVGLLSWILCWISLLVPYYKNRLYDNKAPLYIALVSYFGQSLVNSATTLNVVTLVIMIIILNISNNN